MAHIPTVYKHTGSEMDIQLHIVDNLHDISYNCKWGGVKTVRQQYCFPSERVRIYCDLMLWHQDGTGTLIEVKKYKCDNTLVGAVGQILMYGGFAKIHLYYYQRLVIAADYIPPILKCIIISQKLPIKLLQVDGDIVEYF